MKEKQEIFKKLVKIDKSLLSLHDSKKMNKIRLNSNLMRCMNHFVQLPSSLLFCGSAPTFPSCCEKTQYKIKRFEKKSAGYSCACTTTHDLRVKSFESSIECTLHIKDSLLEYDGFYPQLQPQQREHKNSLGFIDMGSFKRIMVL